MTTMQDVLLAQFEQRVTAAPSDDALAFSPFQWVHNPEWANTGVILVLKGLQSQLEIQYQFNISNCLLKFTGIAVEMAVDMGLHSDLPKGGRLEQPRRASDPARLVWYAEYVDGAAIEQMLAEFDRLLGHVR